MVNSINSFLPKSIYESNKLGVKVARPDIIVPTPNNATSFFTINRSIAQINSREILFLARHDTIDSPLISEPRFLKDTGSRLVVPSHLNVDDIYLKVASADIDLYTYTPVLSIERDGVDGLVGNLVSIEVALENLPDQYFIQIESVDPKIEDSTQ
jgi:hypothetical protein